MKRDWDVIRQILLALEAQNDLQSPINSREYAKDAGLDRDVAFHHFRLTLEADLIRGRDAPLLDGHGYIIAQAMTMSGHELLDQMREPKVSERHQE